MLAGSPELGVPPDAGDEDTEAGAEPEGEERSDTGRFDQVTSVQVHEDRRQDEHDGEDLQQRLRQSCERFLGIDTCLFPSIPFDKGWEQACDEARSIACATPHSVGASAIHELASVAKQEFDLNPATAS